MAESVLERFGRLIENDQLSHAYLVDGQDREARRNFIFRVAAMALKEPGRSDADLLQEMAHNRHVNVQVIDATDPEKLAGKVLEASGRSATKRKTSQKKAKQAEKQPKEKVAQGQSIKIEKIRQLVSELSQSSRDGRDRFYILDDAEKLTLSAANSLLKSLEEPSKGNHLFISVDNQEMVLATIRSRCQWVHLPEVSHDKSRERFERLGLPKELAQWASFQVTREEDAQTLAHDPTYLDQLGAEWKWFSLLGQQPVEAMVSVKKYVTPYCGTRVEAFRYLNDLALLVRDVVIFPYVPSEELTRLDHIEDYRLLCQKRPERYWLAVSEALEQAMKEMKANISTEAVFEGLAVRTKQAL